MSIFFVLLLTTITVFLIMLFVPLCFYVKINFNDKIDGVVRIAGIFPVRLGVRPKDHDKDSVEVNKPGVVKSGHTNFTHIFIKTIRFLLDENLRRKSAGALFRFVRRLAGSVSLRLKKAEIVYGSGDAYHTSVMLGRYYALIYSLGFFELNDKVRITPDFKEKRFEGPLEGVVMVYIGRVLLYSILFLFEWPVISTIKFFRSNWNRY